MSEAREKRSGRLPFVLAILAVLALLPLGAWLVLRDRGAPVPVPVPVAAPAPLVATPVETPPPLPVQKAEPLRIVEIDGTVEIRKGRGPFQPARVGVPLELEDAIRTGAGRARLGAESLFDIQIEPGSFLEIGELSSQLARFKLGLGMVVARVDGRGGRRLEIQAQGSDAVAAATDGTFAMSNNGEGTVAVGARAGEVEFKAAGKAVILRAGQQALAANGPPGEPTPIPPSLFLKVDWPPDSQVNRRRLAVGGRTDPGATLLLAGQAVVVGADGRFKAIVRLREGRNPLEAQGVDVGGNRASSRSDVTLDTTAPESSISTQQLWEK